MPVTVCSMQAAAQWRVCSACVDTKVAQQRRQPSARQIGLERLDACSGAGEWLDRTGVFSQEISHMPAVATATAIWYATLASTQLAGKLLGVSCATPGLSSIAGLGAVATASALSAQASRSIAASAAPQRARRRQRSRPGTLQAQAAALFQIR